MYSEAWIRCEECRAMKPISDVEYGVCEQCEAHNLASRKDLPAIFGCPDCEALYCACE